MKSIDEKINMCEVLIAIRGGKEMWGYRFDGNWYCGVSQISRKEAVKKLKENINKHNERVDKRMNERLWLDGEIEDLLKISPPSETNWSLKNTIKKALGVTHDCFDIKVTGDWIAINESSDEERVVRMTGEKALRVLRSSFADDLQDDEHPHYSTDAEKAEQVMAALYAVRETYKEDSETRN